MSIQNSPTQRSREWNGGWQIWYNQPQFTSYISYAAVSLIACFPATLIFYHSWNTTCVCLVRTFNMRSTLLTFFKCTKHCRHNDEQQIYSIYPCCITEITALQQQLSISPLASANHRSTLLL